MKSEPELFRTPVSNTGHPLYYAFFSKIKCHLQFRGFYDIVIHSKRMSLQVTPVQ